MLESLLGRLPANFIVICAALAFLLPFLVKITNKKLRKITNPTWKKDRP
ncbi:hypothetical protein ACFYKX_05845 [Cytobacillus sp. FJAT-54145]|uniref:Uncharacterized protein n=1 Tax=Cytobacillus spartinae TaxID=3299023 RepID=A0ABW6K7G8_9BACI